MKDEYAFNYILNDATKNTFEGYVIQLDNPLALTKQNYRLLQNTSRNHTADIYYFIWRFVK
jgi:hypothetical protein